MMSLWKKLVTWKGIHLSLGGTITLINFVLSSMPPYFFSFFKAPNNCIKDLNWYTKKVLDKEF